MTPDRNRPSEPPPRARDLGQLADRLHALEVTEAVHHTEVTGKLNGGAETFATLKKDVTDLKEDAKPRRANLLGVASIVLSVGIAVVNVVATASTYVDRPALERAYDKLDGQDDELRDELNALKERLTRAELARAQPAPPAAEADPPKADVLGRRRSR